jgi:flagellar hook-basal body complex protein FliE
VSDINKIGSLSTADLLGQQNSKTEKGSGDFAKELKSALGSVNEEQVKGEKAMADIATGQVKDLHQAAMAIDKAELSMKLMLEVRNKALSAYKELKQTPM